MKLHSNNLALVLLGWITSTSNAYGTVESTLSAIQSKLIGSVLPVVAIIGLIYAGLSFVAGSPNARGRLVLAIIGVIVGFGAPSIMEFVRSMIH